MSKELEVKRLMEKAEKRGVPRHIRDGLVQYVVNKESPGSFLTAVLTNNLKESFARADEVNRASLFEIVCFLWNDVPGNCWGSEEQVDSWLQVVG